MTSRGASAEPLAVTMGDPAGIGPEIVARALAEAPVRAVAVGDASVLARAVEICRLDVDVWPIERVGETRPGPGAIAVLDQGVADASLPFGAVSEIAGRSAVAAIEAATRLALDGHVRGIVTAPISKEAIWRAGVSDLGHTELLARLTGSARAVTMFVVRGLKIFFATRHCSLAEAVGRLDRDLIGAAIADAHLALTVLGIDSPRLAVAALNPHGGEGGKFGREEIDEIAPAVEEARSRGKDVVGPVPADSVFHLGLNGRYDGVVSLYHDQGHIAAKTVDFGGTVSVTMGLPILRTSVDHGTAFDIAGRGVASAEAMRAALRVADELAPRADRMRSTYGPRGLS